MAEAPRQASATIYQFPVGDRLTRSAESRVSAASPAKGPLIMSGTAWYHEAAIEQPDSSQMVEVEYWQ